MGRGSREKPTRLGKKLLQIRKHLGFSQDGIVRALGLSSRLRLSAQEKLESLSNVGRQEGGNLLSMRLQPYREERSGSGSEPSVIKRSGLPQVAILELSLENQRRFKSYQVKISPIETGGPVVVSGLMAEKDVSILKVPIVVNGLRAGDYNLSLSGEDDNNVLVPLDAYSFRISSSR
ncbi:MAG: hypothetical protein QOI89_3228 [Solirubrobacteraceae bacterium]|jgi:transcriptional regulator with XRE-family HTH domain|nr:hypothetical protein [Solirubrobacteraceae bacterium]